MRILTHGFDWAVIRQKYGELLASSGKVVIEDNVFIGTGSIILKGVHIGENTIVGAGSVLTHSIPANSVAAGNPCEVIMSIDEYHKTRQAKYVDEAKAYALEMYRRTGHAPKPADFWEEFPIFLDRSGEWEGIPVLEQMGPALSSFLNSKPLYTSFADFLVDAGIPRDAIDKSA